MRSILDLRTNPEPSRGPWNKDGQDAEKNAIISRSVAALGAKLNHLQQEEESLATAPEFEERNPEMVQATQRAQAAAASAAASTSTGRIPDTPTSPSTAPKQAIEPRSDYELVLGRGQIASCLFAGTVVVAIFAGGAYFAGKLSAVNCVAASNSIPQASAPLQVASVVPSSTDASSNQSGIPYMVNAPAATVITNNSIETPKPLASASSISAAGVNAGSDITNQAAPVSTALPDDAKGSPLFANPRPGALYLQVGAVEKGMGMVIAEGLRQHGLASFVAPGPSDRIFRVLVGPFATQEEYRRAKAEVDSINVGNFARQFEK